MNLAGVGNPTLTHTRIMMNTQVRLCITLVALIGALVTHAYAEEAAVAGKTRAEVIAELEQAKADGSYERLHRQYISHAEDLPVSSVSRDSVQAELARARSDGSYEAGHSEARRADEGFTGHKTREDVQRELEESLHDPAWQAKKLQLYSN
ncbi:DUF4148 domain-containing protein [Oxalobacteraceae bacterium OM1]|nr:DUF4148 domain-containing protein [Oxalobacteraceae bacterium OM1]